MELDELLHNGEPQTQPAITSARRMFLTKSIEYMRKKFRTDSGPGVGHGYPEM